MFSFIRRYQPFLIIVMMYVIGGSFITFTIANAQTSTPEKELFCSERSSTYRDGVLIYECEIEERNGEYFVVERDANGIIAERAADVREVAEYLATTTERSCIENQRSAVVALSTPARDSTLTTIAERVQLIESAIRKCVE